jgi:hypothetical protein
MHLHGHISMQVKWDRYVTDDQGIPYYHNPETNETVWQLPSGAICEDESEDSGSDDDSRGITRAMRAASVVTPHEQDFRTTPIPTSQPTTLTATPPPLSPLPSPGAIAAAITAQPQTKKQTAPATPSTVTATATVPRTTTSSVQNLPYYDWKLIRPDGEGTSTHPPVANTFTWAANMRVG